MSRTLAVLLVALGLAGVSVALGLLYIDFREREGRWVELTTAAKVEGRTPHPDETDMWFQHDRVYAALGFGTAGVAMLGAGVMIGVFELPWFRRGRESAA